MPRSDVTRNLLRPQRSREAGIKRSEGRTAELVESSELLEREVSARKRAAKETRLLLTLIEAIDNAKGFQAARNLNLPTVCKFTNKDYGEA